MVGGTGGKHDGNIAEVAQQLMEQVFFSRGKGHLGSDILSIIAFFMNFGKNAAEGVHLGQQDTDHRILVHPLERQRCGLNAFVQIFLENPRKNPRDIIFKSRVVCHVHNLL